MSNFNLKDKIIVIAGGAGLIGSAFSRACTEHQARVVVLDFDEKRGKNLLKQTEQGTGSNSAVFLKCDITKIEQVKEAVNQALAKYGKIDALVNTAYPKGRNYGKRFEDVSYGDFCQNINMHLGAYFLITQETAKVMMKQNYGNIINVASIYGVAAPDFSIYEGTAMVKDPEYPACKGGIIMLTKYLASYLGKYNIRVNAISPGGVFDNQPDKFVKRYSEKVILGKRMAKPEDFTGTLIFLLSDASKYITGQNIVVDGGFTL